MKSVRVKISSYIKIQVLYDVIRTHRQPMFLEETMESIIIIIIIIRCNTH